MPIQMCAYTDIDKITNENLVQFATPQYETKHSDLKSLKNKITYPNKKKNLI